MAQFCQCKILVQGCYFAIDWSKHTDNKQITIYTWIIKKVTYKKPKRWSTLHNKLKYAQRNERLSDCFTISSTHLRIEVVHVHFICTQPNFKWVAETWLQYRIARMPLITRCNITWYCTSLKWSRHDINQRLNHTKYIPYLPLKRELWGAFWGDFGEKRQCYNGTAL